MVNGPNEMVQTQEKCCELEVFEDPEMRTDGTGFNIKQEHYFNAFTLLNETACVYYIQIILRSVQRS